MAKLTLFHCPTACSRVTMTALEAAGCEYDDVLVDLMSGGHLKPEYRAINPRGKVPALLIDGELLTENAAILSWINAAFPAAQLLPATTTPLEHARQLSDLFWLSSTWHPAVRALRMPGRWTMGDIEPVRERGRDLMNPLVAEMEERLTDSAWYYGASWSSVDVYLYWTYTTAELGTYDLSAYPAINRHRQQVEALPAFIAALAREEQAKARALTPA